MKKILLDGKEYYIKDEVFSDDENIFNEEDTNQNSFENTLEIDPLDDKDFLDDTLTDIWSDNNE